MIASMTPWFNSDRSARSALAIDTNTSSLNMTGNVGTGTANYTALTSLMGTLVSGDVVRLPAGTVLVDFGANAANYITIPAGVRILGHPRGTTLKATNPGASHSPFRLSSNVTFEDLTFQWDMSSHPGSGSTCTLLFGDRVDGVTIRRCKFFGDADTGSGVAVGSQLYWLGGVSPIQLWGCTNITFDECEVARSTGTNYGITIIGGSYHRYNRCYFHHNAADGVKMFGNNDQVGYGPPSRMRFTSCRSDYNGQTIIQGQTVYTTTYTSTTTITPTSGARYLLNFASAGNLTLNNGANGDTILIAKTIGSQNVAIKNQAGTTLFTMTAATNDKTVERLTFTGGAWYSGPLHDYYTNGEGWDFLGSDVVLTDCSAEGNEGAGFQVKPTFVGAVGKNIAKGIRFDGCSAVNTWGYNGFAIVNAIADVGGSRDTSPQDITFSNCVADGNPSSGFIFSSGALPIFSITMSHCVATNNGACGVQIQGPTRFVSVNSCRFEGNGSSGWNVILYAAKGVRFHNCYFSGVDPTAQGLLIETDINNTVNARCYGVLIDKSLGGTMADVVFDFCRWHNHLQSNGISTDIRLYTGGNTPALVADYGQTVASGVLSLSSVSNGILKINTQQTAALAHSQTTAYNAGTTYSLVDGVTGIPSVVANGGNLYRYINATPSSGNAPPNATYWVQAGNDIISLT